MPINPQLPQWAPQNPMQLTGEMSSIVNRALPGFDNLSSSATGIVGNLMGGMPSASTSRRANAYFGAGSGMGNSDFVRNRGFDLYGKDAEAYKQRGFDDFLKLLSGYSGTVMPTVGQQQAGSQFDRNLQFQRENAQAQVDLEQQGLDQNAIRSIGSGRESGSPLGQNRSYTEFYDPRRGRTFASITG